MRDWMDSRKVQVKQALTDLRRDGANWMRGRVFEFYRAGVKSVSDGFPGKKVPDFAEVHRDAMRAIAEQSIGKLNAATFHIARTVEGTMRDLQFDVVSDVTLATGSVYEYRKELLDRLERAGVIGEDRRVVVGGRSWQVEKYVEMVARTSIANAFRSSQIRSFKSIDHDLVQVIGSTGCPLCRPFVGSVLSISGKSNDFPSVADARASGLFHPNCVHHMIAYMEEFTSKEDQEMIEAQTHVAKQQIKGEKKKS